MIIPFFLSYSSQSDNETIQVFVLVHWFLKAEDISNVKGYEKAEMYVDILLGTHRIYCLMTFIYRYIGAIGGIERVKSNWEDIWPCALIEGVIVSMFYLLSHFSFEFNSRSCTSSLF
jgi:hypothetical protein